MTIPVVKVVLRKNRSLFYEAFVEQMAADSPIRGCNLLPKRQLTLQSSAMRAVKEKLSGRVDKILWEMEL